MATKKLSLTDDMMNTLLALEAYHENRFALNGRSPCVGGDDEDPSNVASPKVASALVKKGLVTWEGTQIRITEKGLEAVKPKNI
jgi:predicted methyltransferase